MQDFLDKRRHSERMERREKILGAAKTVFLEKGYFKTNIRDIARAATLSPGAIYYYFGGIDEIYAEICEGSFQLINQLLKREKQKKGPALKKIENMARSFSEYYAEHPEYFDLFAFSDLGWKRVGLKEELAARLDRALKQALSTVQSVIEDGIKKGEIKNIGDSRQVSYALWSGIEGALSINRRGLLENAGFKIGELIETQTRMILKGLGSIS